MHLRINLLKHGTWTFWWVIECHLLIFSWDLCICIHQYISIILFVSLVFVTHDVIFIEIVWKCFCFINFLETWKELAVGLKEFTRQPIWVGFLFWGRHFISISNFLNSDSSVQVFQIILVQPWSVLGVQIYPIILGTFLIVASFQSNSFIIVSE